MNKSFEKINKAMLQMIIDDSNNKCRFLWARIKDDNGVLYKSCTDGYVAYILPETECCINFPVKNEKDEEPYKKLFAYVPFDARQIKTYEVVTVLQQGTQKLIKAYRTYEDNIYINLDLLKGFGNEYTLFETEKKYLYAVKFNGNICGYVMGFRSERSGEHDGISNI